MSTKQKSATSQLLAQERKALADKARSLRRLETLLHKLDALYLAIAQERDFLEDLGISRAKIIDTINPNEVAQKILKASTPVAKKSESAPPASGENKPFETGDSWAN